MQFNWFSSSNLAVLDISQGSIWCQVLSLCWMQVDWSTFSCFAFSSISLGSIWSQVLSLCWMQVDWSSSSCFALSAMSQGSILSQVLSLCWLQVDWSSSLPFQPCSRGESESRSGLVSRSNPRACSRVGSCRLRTHTGNFSKLSGQICPYKIPLIVLEQTFGRYTTLL